MIDGCVGRRRLPLFLLEFRSTHEFKSTSVVGIAVLDMKGGAETILSYEGLAR